MADDLVFTKNGEDFRQPWMLMHMADMMETYAVKYPNSGKLRPQFFRKKALYRMRQRKPPWCGLVDHFLLCLCWPVNMLQVRAGDVETADHSKDLPLLGVRHDGQAEDVVFDKQFQGPVERVIGSQRFHIAPHQVFGQDKRVQITGLRSKMDFLQVDHTQEVIVIINDGKDSSTVPRSSQYLLYDPFPIV